MWHCDKSQQLFSGFWANVSSGRDKYLVSRIYLETWQQLLLSINRICDIKIHNGAQCFNNCIAWTNLWISHILTAGTEFKRNIMLNEEYLCMKIYLTIDTADLMCHDIYISNNIGLVIIMKYSWWHWIKREYYSQDFFL